LRRLYRSTLDGFSPIVEVRYETALRTRAHGRRHNHQG